jgi:hypothetical protein
MTGPSCIAGAFAALMIVIALGCAGRLVAGYLRRRNSEPDVDGLHILMGVAMAGMFEPRLGPLPDIIWRAVFAIATAWFASQAIRTGIRGTPGHSRLAHPLPHAVESAAMIYMLWPPGHRPESGAAGMVMSAMTGPAAATVRNPVIPLALALFMVGYIVWTADHLTQTKPHADWGRAALAPRLAACYKIVMGIAMGYMLVLML